MVAVLALNCSPRMDRSNTSMVLNPYLEGLRDVGAEVELIHIRKLDIHPCTGEFHCWVKQPGRCYQDDDMQTLYPKLQKADIWVFATPVYVDGVSGLMKNLLDRTIPLLEPFFELREGHCRHPLRSGSKQGKVVLVSNCGFWEMDNFEPLINHMKAACRNMNRQFAGALLRPHGPALTYMKKEGSPVDDVFEAAREAGRQLIRDGKMSVDTLDTIARELVPLEKYVEQVNRSFQEVLNSATCKSS